MFRSLFFIIISFSCILFLKNQVFAGHGDGLSVYSYDGIPGCSCFYHCKCFGHFIRAGYEESFPEDSKWHPTYPEDKVWHEFMKKLLSAQGAGPYIPSTRSSFRHMVTGSNMCGYICLLSEYLNVSDEVEREIESARLDTVEWFKTLYPKPREQEKLNFETDRINNRASVARQILSTIPETIIPLYKKVIEDCPHNEQDNMVRLYNKGLISLLEGNVEESLTDVNAFIEIAKKNKQENIITSKVFQRQGECFLEVGLYNEAISSLNKAITKDPKNLEAYFQRASAYFETGDFDHSLDDYINSKKSGCLVPSHSAPIEFIDGFSQAAFNGALDATCEFIPSLCHTIYGLGECLWMFGEHPVDSVRNLADAGYEIGEIVVDYLQTVDRDTLHEYADELVKLYENYSSLSDHDKGELIGYTVGKYGVDIFAGSIFLKGISAYKKLKAANRICNFESMAMSASSKEAIITKGLHQHSERRRFFESRTIEWGHQQKHIVGANNYNKSLNKAIWENPDAEGLLKKYAGTGTPKRGVMGQPGYQEIVDFEEHVGIWISKDGSQSLQTTKGTIHYSKKGAHIVPEYPDEKMW